VRESSHPKKVGGLILEESGNLSPVKGTKHILLKISFSVSSHEAFAVVAFRDITTNTQTHIFKEFSLR